MEQIAGIARAGPVVSYLTISDIAPVYAYRKTVGVGYTSLQAESSLEIISGTLDQVGAIMEVTQFVNPTGWLRSRRTL